MEGCSPSPIHTLVSRFTGALGGWPTSDFSSTFRKGPFRDTPEGAFAFPSLHRVRNAQENASKIAVTQNRFTPT